MASFVIDTSVIIEYIIDSVRTADAALFFRQRNSGDQLYIPEFCLLECTNVVWKRVRFAGVKYDDAVAILDGLQMLRLAQVPMEPLLKRSLQIAVKSSLAV